MEMKTNRDFIFGLSVMIWIMANIISYIIFDIAGVAVSNITCIVLFGTMTIIKLTHPPFEEWLKKRLI